MPLEACMTSPRSRIAWQLATALALVLVLLISVSTVFALRSLNEANLVTRQEHIGSEARLLADQLSTFHDSLRESTQRLAGLFERRFSGGLSVQGAERIAVAGMQTPARDVSGRVIAVLFVGFDYTDGQNAQFENLKRFRIGTTGSLALLDDQGKWLVAPAGAREPEQIAGKLAEVLAEPGHGAFWGDGVEEFLSVAMPFSGGPWQVLASMPREEIQSVTWRVGSQLAIGSLVTLLLAVAAVIWLLRRKLRPLGDLVQQAQALGAGDLSARLNVTSQDEIGELARNFNQMGEALSTMVARIRGAAHNVTSRAQALSGLASGAYEAIEQQSGEISSMAGAVEEFSATSLNIADNMRNTERLASDNAQQTRIGRS